MNEHSDLGWFTFGADQPAVNLSGISVSGGVLSANPTNNDPNFWLLDTFIPGSAALGKVGRNFPIDASKIPQARAADAAHEPARSHVRALGDADLLEQQHDLRLGTERRPADEHRGFPPTAASPTNPGGWNIYVVDLVTLGSASGPGWSGSVDSLRIDPTQYPDSGQIQLDWARLVPLDDANLQRTIQWTGAASVDIFLDSDNNEANGHLGQIARGASGGSFAFYVGGIAPGDYYVAMRAAGTTERAHLLRRASTASSRSPPWSSPRPRRRARATTSPPFSSTTRGT